jgi:pimeloyl-ACP methyl ester carboxylesterase
MSLWINFLGAEIRWVTVDRVPTRVVRAGRGDPAFVLLHGRGGHLESWAANVGELARHGQVIAFDLLGHGMTGRHDGDYGVAELTAHATRTLDVLGVSDTVLVGQSLGGWVATHIALERPDLARALVLVEPAGLQTEADRLADPRVAAAYQRGGRAFEEPTAENVRTRLLGLVSDPSVIDDELVQTRLLLYAPAEARAVHRAVRRADNAALVLTPATMAGLTLPVLIIHGALANTPAAVVAEAARAAGARVVTIDGAKQWPQAERPDAVNRLVADFRRSVNRRPLPALNG